MLHVGNDPIIKVHVNVLIIKNGVPDDIHSNVKSRYGVFGFGIGWSWGESRVS